ncbi:hypothetical protein V2A60_000722 [Cordyceps javanica]
MDPRFPLHPAECGNFKRGDGRCSFGANCRFLHSELTDGLKGLLFPEHQAVQFRSREEKHIAQDELIIPEESWVRHLKGVFVTFGAGATIASVAMPWDSSAARIYNLPRVSQASSISAYLDRQLSTQIPESDIYVLPSSRSSVRNRQFEVDVTMNDPNSAQELVKVIDSDPTCKLRAECVIPRQHRAARFNEISRNKVCCSWHKPTRTFTLTFADESTAWMVHDEFFHGRSVIFHCRVLSRRPEPSEEEDDASKWTVQISRVPELATERDFEAVLGMTDPQVVIKRGPATYDCSLENAIDEIIKRLLHFGPLDAAATTSSDSQSRRYKLTVRFVDSRHAADAVRELKGSRLPFDSNGMLTVQQLSTVRTRIPDHVYAAAAQDLDALYAAWKKDFFVSTIISRPHNRFRKIRFEGQVHDNVVAAYAAFESIVAGELLKEDGGTLWSASFATNGWGYNRMRLLEKQLGVLVLCDRRQRTLRMLGPRESFGAARYEIAKLCSLDPRCEFSIGLDPAEAGALPWLLAGGYRYIRDTVGWDKVALDVALQPRRLVISGSERDLQVAQTHWNSRHRADAAAAVAPQQEGASGGPLQNECTLCGFKPEYCPIQTHCRHIYCGACFEAMCLSCAGTPARTPAVRCYGDGGRCKQILTLPAMQERLSSSALERVFERMFTTFLSANSDQYRYCPTSGCEQVYRVRAALPDGAEPPSEFEFNCPQCLVAICSRCHVSHDTIHCPLLEQAEELEDY